MGYVLQTKVFLNTVEKVYILGHEMRLFIKESVTMYGNHLVIVDKRILRHAQVVRLQVGERIAIQSSEVRYLGVVEELSKKQLIMNVQSEQQLQSEHSGRSVSMAVALPNTGAKLDLIVEKLTEVGVSQIVFFPAERSQIRKFDQKKLEKLSLRALEASEQSNRWVIPQISVVGGLEDVLALDGQKVLFDKQKEGGRSRKRDEEAVQILGLVGPEGGWTASELQTMDSITRMSLGNTILRMETAAIVGAWRLIHSV